MQLYSVQCTHMPYRALVQYTGFGFNLELPQKCLYIHYTACIWSGMIIIIVAGDNQMNTVYVNYKGLSKLRFIWTSDVDPD